MSKTKHQDRIAAFKKGVHTFRLAKIGGTLKTCVPAKFAELSVNDLQDPVVAFMAPRDINMLLGQYLMQMSDLFADGELSTVVVNEYGHRWSPSEYSIDPRVFPEASSIGLVDRPTGLFIDLSRRWLETTSSIYDPVPIHTAQFWKKHSFEKVPVRFRKEPFVYLPKEYVNYSADARQANYDPKSCCIVPYKD